MFGLLGLVALGAFVIAAGAVVLVVSAWLGRPIIAFGGFGAPDQPIAFSHVVHAGDLGLDCLFCHRNATKGEAATVPAVGLCMACHVTVGDDNPEVARLRDMAGAGQPIQWVRVHRVPDHVQFTHEPHIRFFAQRDQVAPSAVCAICHGDVAAMAKVEQVRSLKMGDCVACHRDNDAPTDCAACHY